MTDDFGRGGGFGFLENFCSLGEEGKRGRGGGVFFSFDEDQF